MNTKILNIVIGKIVVLIAMFPCKLYGKDVSKELLSPIVLTDSVFSSSSFWYTPIPHDATLHPNSEQFVKEFLRQKKAYYGTVNINTRAYASPVYVVTNEVERTKVTEWDCQKKKFFDPLLAHQWNSVPIPDEAEPAEGTDAELVIYQPSSDSIWEFWQARKIDGKWHACWGGKLENASKSNGIWPRHYGTTATGLPFLGGQITAEELIRGEIRHAIGIALVDTEHSKIFSWPANRSDGENPTMQLHRIPEGIRIRLNPNINVDTLKMHPIGKIIAKAAQKYGFVVWDRAGAISIRAQNPKSYTLDPQESPYRKLFNGTPSYAILNGFPWDHLQFMPMDYGKPKF